jgi:uncharacterized small protein (DUF1192 family)
MNQINIEKPEHLTSLASSGVLVSVTVNLWSATKLDQGISDEVSTSKNAVSAAGRYTKNLLANNPKHKALMNYRQTVANWMKRMTYDWNGDQRYLPTPDVPKFMTEYRQHQAAFGALFNDFDASYEDIISDMAFKAAGLGDMFNRNDYPTREKMQKKYGIHLFVNDVPMNDYRVLVAKDMADELFDVYASQTQRIVEGIVTDQFQRMKDVMESLSFCCDVDVSVGADGEQKIRKRKIYDSTVEKARDMVRLYKEFNLTGNAELSESIAMLENTLRDVNAEILRESDLVRSEVKEGVDEILNRFGSFKCFEE